jgi:hypothetical protein
MAVLDSMDISRELVSPVRDVVIAGRAIAVMLVIFGV